MPGQHLDDPCDDCGIRESSCTIVIEVDQPQWPYASGINGRYCRECASIILGITPEDALSTDVS